MGILLPPADWLLPTGYSRSGATLLEVLVAIFIMGIGLIALLVLFPLGALTMAQAIRNERAAHAAVAASAAANIHDFRRDALLYTIPNDAFHDPAYLFGLAKGSVGQANLEKRSFPILIDPVGYRTAAGLQSQNSVGGLPPATSLLLTRSSASIVENAVLPETPSLISYRWFTFQDDIVFDKAGNAHITAATNPPTIERDVRFSLAYLLQRPRTADPSVVDCSVIIYDSRPVGLAGNLDLPEFPYFLFDAGTGTSEVTFTPSTNNIRIHYGAPFNKVAPPIRSGDWVLDVSIYGGEPHAFFYRVAGVSDSGTYLDLETQQPLRGFGNAASVGTNQGGRLLFMEGVAEVFERNVGKEPAKNQ
jgi:hypothetical protein